MTEPWPFLFALHYNLRISNICITIKPEKVLEGVVLYVNRPNHTNTNPNRRTIVLSWIAVGIMAGIIFWMSANTGSDINQGLGIISTIKAFLADSLATLFGYSVDVSPIGHFVEYCILGILLYNALRFHTHAPFALILALVIGSLYGITDEIHQYFVPERSSDPADWLVDTVAVFAGALITQAVLRARVHYKSRKN